MSEWEEDSLRRKGKAGRFYRVNMEKVRETLFSLYDYLYDGFPDIGDEWIEKKRRECGVVGEVNK